MRCLTLLLVFCAALYLPGCVATARYQGFELEIKVLADRESQLRALSAATGDPSYAIQADQVRCQREHLENTPVPNK